MDNTADFYSANASSILARPTNFCLKEFKMSFGEASNGFFWLGYYGDTSDWWWAATSETLDDWFTYCMGGEL